jgi:D-tyrosyl-tRNA(Tyr) deacylase
MRAVIQRVRHASVTINGGETRAIGRGLVVLVAIEDADTAADIGWLTGKIVRLSILADERGLMNRSVRDEDAEILVVSQFTLFASTRKGNRPSFDRSAKPATAIPLYHQFISQLQADLGRRIETGEFGADMLLTVANDGPVTILMDSRQPD